MSRKLILPFAIAIVFVQANPAPCDDGEDKLQPWYEWISLSGELRTRVEGLFNFTGPQFPADTDHSLTLAHTRLKLEAETSESITAVIQFQDSRAWGEEPSTAANIRNVDLHQEYFEWRKTSGSNFALKLGRQELSYGDERLVGAFGWSNIGRSFDAIKLYYLGDGYRLNGFHATTVETGSTAEDADFLYAQRSLRF